MKRSASSSYYDDSDEDSFLAIQPHAEIESPQRKRQLREAPAALANSMRTIPRMRAPDIDATLGTNFAKPEWRPGGQQNALSMYNFSLRVLQQDSAVESRNLLHSVVHETWEYEALGQAIQKECDGDRVCRMLQEAWGYFDTHGYERSPQQRVMLKAWLAISYGQFYGKDIQQHMPRLLRENAWSELRAEMVVLMARRGGKTIMVSLGASAEIVCIPWPHDVLIYSNNQRASKMLMLQSYKFCKMLSCDPHFGGKVITLNKSEHMQFQTRFGNINEMFAYPAKPETLRGTGSKNKTGTVVAEEFAYMRLEVVYEIIGPTLTRSNVKFVGITTTSGADSFVTPLTEARFDDGRAVILTLNFELVCQDCKDAGIPEKCKCLMADIPHWQSATQHNKLEIIMKDHLQTYLRELKGFQIDQSISPAFDPPSVQFLRKPESVIFQTDIFVPQIFTAIDPACCGDYSKFAIVSAAFFNSTMVVSG